MSLIATIAIIHTKTCHRPNAILRILLNIVLSSEVLPLCLVVLGTLRPTTGFLRAVLVTLRCVSGPALAGLRVTGLRAGGAGLLAGLLVALRVGTFKGSLTGGGACFFLTCLIDMVRAFVVVLSLSEGSDGAVTRLVDLPHSGQNDRILLLDTHECPLEQVKRNSSATITPT